MHLWVIKEVEVFSCPFVDLGISSTSETVLTESEEILQ